MDLLLDYAAGSQTLLSDKIFFYLHQASLDRPAAKRWQQRSLMDVEEQRRIVLSYQDWRLPESRQSNTIKRCDQDISKLMKYLVIFLYATGAFGYFEVTHDITRYCKAKVFEHVGKTTPVAVRFSTVGKVAFMFICLCIGGAGVILLRKWVNLVLK